MSELVNFELLKTTYWKYQWLSTFFVEARKVVPRSVQEAQTPSQFLTNWAGASMQEPKNVVLLQLCSILGINRGFQMGLKSCET